MTLEIKNIKLDKQIYIYGKDKHINLSFEIKSIRNEVIDKITIFYGYNFFGEKQKHNAYQDKIIKKNIGIFQGMDKNYSFTLPIKFFNLNVNEGLLKMKIENYINIEINNGIFNKKVIKKIFPNIILDEKSYGLKNLIILDKIKNLDIKDSFNNKKEEIEKLIKKNDYEEYSKITNDIKNKYSNLNKLTDSIRKEDFQFLLEKINKLTYNKDKLFIIKTYKQDEYKSLLYKKNELNKKFSNLNGNDISEYRNILNQSYSLEKEIYKCYASDNESEYYNKLDLYYDEKLNKVNNSTSRLDYLYKKIEISKEIKKNHSDFIKIKKHFNGIIFGGLFRSKDEDYLTVDYINREVYNKLKQNIFINIYDKLVNSKIYNFIYKYSFIFYIFSLILYYTKNVIPNSFVLILFILIILSALFPIILIKFSKSFENFIQNKLIKEIYNFKIKNTKEIENNIRNNLIKGNLKINDVFEEFNLKKNEFYMDYNFYVTLNLKVGTYNNRGSNTDYYIYDAYSLQLFNYSGKRYIDLNKIVLVENNYKELSDILPNSNKSPETKIYYTLKYKFDSNYLPNINGEIDLYLNFN